MLTLWGLVLGTAFGFVLHRVGASQADNIINMLKWKDLRILHFMLLVIGISVIGISILGAMGIAHLSIKEAIVPGLIVGGLLFGVGFAISGYCPGTSLIATAEGKKDALFTVIGGLVGALFYALIYPTIKAFVTGYTLGKVTLLDIFPTIPALLVALVFGGLIIYLAFNLKGCTGQCDSKKK